MNRPSGKKHVWPFGHEFFGQTIRPAIYELNKNFKLLSVLSSSTSSQFINLEKKLTAYYNVCACLRTKYIIEIELFVLLHCTKN